MIDQAKTRDIQPLANLIHFSPYVHRHLDYRPPLDWVGDYPFNILRENNQIIAALACPPDPPHVAWIRLFAATRNSSISQAWETLWNLTKAQLKEKGSVDWVVAIPLQTWFSRLLSSQGFELIHHIVVLAMDNLLLPQAPTQSGISIRPMALNDIETVAHVDRLSFAPIWQFSAEYIRIAYLEEGLSTVAEHDGKICGFQISTLSSANSHLARLAVIPTSQGKGIGYALLYDLVCKLRWRGIETVTVNTQEDNKASLALYKKMGFVTTGEKYPVFQFSL